ncbi:MAG TPA: hypothetical protein VG408_10915, partial [Actinomycetota bacterium]|nr:hypothetical protein [Actinomycetota bacterium]
MQPIELRDVGSRWDLIEDRGRTQEVGQVLLTADRRRRLCMLTALTLWTATLVALGPSPVQASYSEEGVSLSTEIVREEVTYALNVKALEIRGGNWLKLSISRSSDAAGSSLRQNQTWHFPLGAEGFTQEEGSWRIDAGSETGPFDIDLVVERRQDARCSDDQDLFVTVPEGGGLRVETGNNTFETITE